MTKSSSRLLFTLMFTIFLFLNINYMVLRSIRNTLVVVDLGSGAHWMPFFELCGAMPAAVLMTWALGKGLNRFSIKKVFFCSLAIFLGFFLTFATVIYPFVSYLKHTGQLLYLVNASSLIFYAVCELWKPALGMILFWGLVNQYMPLETAKKYYAPLMLAGSLGSILAGPFIACATSEKIWRFFPLAAEQWVHGLILMMCLIVLIGIVTAYLYHRLYIKLQELPVNQEATIAVPEKISFKESLFTCWNSKSLRLLSWIVIVDYVAYALGEVIFLDLLKQQLPKPIEYCKYTGSLGVYIGLLTAISSLCITPFILQRCRWVVAASITPICLLLTEGLFFICLRTKSLSLAWFGWNEIEWRSIAIILGSIQYCLCRAAKHTLFDSSKEIAFVAMKGAEKLKGKLVVDGLCARLGRSGASILSLSLIQICAGVMGSAFITGTCAIALALSGVLSIGKLGKLLAIPYQSVVKKASRTA